jgi:membrane protein
VWTVSSLIETIRDILRRAYGTQVAGRASALSAAGNRLVMLAVVALLISLYLQVAIAAALELARITLRPMAGRAAGDAAGADGRAVRRALSAVLCAHAKAIAPPLSQMARRALVTLWWALVSTGCRCCCAACSPMILPMAAWPA